MMIHWHKKNIWLAVCIFSVIFVGPGKGLGGTGTTVTFSDFSDLSAFTLNGSAAAIHSGSPIFFNGKNVLRLTDNGATGGITGSGFLTTPIMLGPDGSFNSTFEFQISAPAGIGDADGIGGDGFMFVLQTQDASALGTGGGYLGYGHGQATEPPSIKPSFGIEFDTFDNGTFNPPDGDPILDPNGNHIGINLGGSLVSVVAVPVATRLNNGLVWHAWIDYDGPLDLLEVRLSPTPIRPSTALLSHTVDLIPVLGSTDVFAGFTGGISGARSVHDIRSWQFTAMQLTVPFEDFAFLQVKIAFNDAPNTDRFGVKGEFTLGPTNDGVNLVTDDVEVTVGTGSVTIPAGALTAVGPKFTFKGDVGGVDVAMTIQEIGFDAFKFSVQAEGVDLADTSNPVGITVRIGNDAGTANVRLEGLLNLP